MKNTKLHMAILLASISKGESRILNTEFDEDTKNTINISLALGSKVYVEANPNGKSDIDIKGPPDNIPREFFYCDIGNNLEAFAYALPIVMSLYDEVLFDGSSNEIDDLAKSYKKIFDKHQIKTILKNSESLPMESEGKIQNIGFDLNQNTDMRIILGLFLSLGISGSKINATLSENQMQEIKKTSKLMEKFGIKTEIKDNTISTNLDNISGTIIEF